MACLVSHVFLDFASEHLYENVRIRQYEESLGTFLPSREFDCHRPRRPRLTRLMSLPAQSDLLSSPRISECLSLHKIRSLWLSVAFEAWGRVKQTIQRASGRPRRCLRIAWREKKLWSCRRSSCGSSIPGEQTSRKASSM